MCTVSSWLFFRVYKRIRKELHALSIKILIQTLSFYKRNLFFLTHNLDLSIKLLTIFQLLIFLIKIIQNKYTADFENDSLRPRVRRESWDKSKNKWMKGESTFLLLPL